MEVTERETDLEDKSRGSGILLRGNAERENKGKKEDIINKKCGKMSQIQVMSIRIDLQMGCEINDQHPLLKTNNKPLRFI